MICRWQRRCYMCNFQHVLLELPYKNKVKPQGLGRHILCTATAKPDQRLTGCRPLSLWHKHSMALESAPREQRCQPCT